MIMEDKSDDIKRQWEKCKSFDELEDLVLEVQQLKIEELSDTGKYTGNISKPPVDFIENDCSKVEKCFHSHYNSESENEKSTCYSDHTGSDFGDDECDRNLEDVKSNIMLAFEIISKNKQVNVFREDIMFILDKVTNLQGHNQALQKQLEESKLKMKKVSKKSSKVIRKLQAEKDDVVKEKMAIIQKLEIEKEQLAEISHMQFEEITTLTSQLEKSRKMFTKEIADSNEIMIACHKRIKEESALRQRFEDSTNQLNEILNQQKCSSIKESDVKCNHEHEAAILVENKSKCCSDHSSHYTTEHEVWNEQKRTPSYGYRRGFNGYCFRCNTYGHKAINCRVCLLAKVSEGTYAFHIQCYNCHYFGHFARDLGCREV